MLRIVSTSVSRVSFILSPRVVARSSTFPMVAARTESLVSERGLFHVVQEVQLAVAEMEGKARLAGRSATTLAVGGALAHLGLLGVLASIALALSAAIPLWAASLLLGVVVLVVGFALIRAGESSNRLSEGRPRGDKMRRVTT